MRVGLEGFGSPMKNLPDVVIEDDRGNKLRISAREALELMELLENNAGMLRQVRDDEKGKREDLNARKF